MIRTKIGNQEENAALSLSVLALLALAAGATYPLAFAPFHFFLLLFLSSAALFWLICQGPRHGALLAWCYGIGKYAVGVSWIYVSIHDHGGASPLLAAGLVAGFVAFMAVFCWPIGWFVGLIHQLQSRGGKLAPGLAFVAVWVLMEWVLTWFLTGFPWLFAGYGVLGLPLQGYVPVLGTLGVSLLVVMCAVALVWAADRHQRKSIRMSALLGIMAVVGFGGVLDGHTWTSAQERFDAALVQGNLDQGEKWDNDKRMVHVRKHLALSEDHWGADLLIWPEFALTVYGGEAEQVTRLLHQRGQRTQTNVVIGMPDLQWREDGSYLVFNSAQGFGLASGDFAKHHLVPFGDYVPLQSYLRGLIEFFDLPMSAATAGSREQEGIALQLGSTRAGTKTAMGICYEIAFGESLRRNAVDSGVLLTLSNDTWFGGSIGPHQHMQIAQMRALENGRWLLRATNNGITAIVNDRGQIQAQLPQFEAAVLRGEFQVMTGRTPYSYLGDLPVLVVLLLLLVASVIRSASLAERAAKPRNFS